METMVYTQEKLEQFRLQLFSQEKSTATIQKYLRDVKSFLLFSHKQVLDRQTVIDYKAYLAAHYAASSVNSMIAALNAYLRFLNRSDLCIRQLRIQQNTYIPQEKELSRREYERLIRTAFSQDNLKLALIIQTICCTGIRVSELSYITVEAVRNGQATVNCKGKVRMIFIVKDLRRALMLYAQDNSISNGPIFITRCGNPVSRISVWRQMKALCLKAHVLPGKVFPHNLRHLFARLFYSQEKDIVKLADVLGHASINTTRIYTVTTGEEHRKHMEKLELIVDYQKK